MKPCGHEQHDPECRICYLAMTDARYRELWGMASLPTSPLSCIHLGEPTGETITCPSCRGSVQLKLFKCEVYGQCTLGKSVGDVACCNGSRGPDGKHHPCEGYSLEKPATIPSSAPAVPLGKKLKWSYGVTTVLERRDDLLPQTLASLRSAGFDKPRLFVDGDTWNGEWDRFGLEMTFRYPTIRTHGNWILSLQELFIRETAAERFAIFQDDFITSKNLKTYLEALPYPDGSDGRERGYLNLYTFPANQERFPMEGQTGRQKFGWMLSNQFGRGAVALVFNRDAVLALLSSPHMVERPLDPNRGWKAVDGGIVTAMAKAGWKEYVHNPSLVQHTGLVSSMRNRPHKLSISFQGEDFDCLELLK